MDVVLQDRLIFEKEWISIMFLGIMLLIALIKLVNPIKFNDFIKLIYSDKYVRLSQSDKFEITFFKFLVFILMLIGVSFIIFWFWTYYHNKQTFDYILFIKAFTLTTTFILGKFYVEKIISITLDLEPILDKIYFLKLSYLGYILMMMLPIFFILFLNQIINNVVVFSIITVLILGYLFSYLKFLQLYGNKIFPKLYYFILYICALEIAPYFLLSKYIR